MREKIFLIVTLFVAVSLFAAAINPRPQAQSNTGTDGLFTIALTGDSIITQRLSPFKEPEYLSMIDVIRSADVGFTNLEMLLHDYEGYPSAQSGGVYMRAEPIIAKELAWAGFDMVARANNHSGDYSPESMRTTTKYLDEAGIVHAGVGENLQQAREARYLETGDGRVALISCSSTFPVHSAAGRQRSDVGGRPGLSPLRFQTRYVVDQASIDSMKRTLTSLGMNAGQAANQVQFMGNSFVAGPQPNVEQTPNADDLAEIVASIKDA
jgi:poly-gamma-glutamate synthesis protein (capsule biosynthesis protein)